MKSQQYPSVEAAKENASGSKRRCGRI